MTTTSAPTAALVTASCRSSAVSTGTTATPGGTLARMVAATRVTSAPRAAATSAKAAPCFPDERLPRNRTGSSGSRVPPAVTTTRRPPSDWLVATTARHAAYSSSGSGSRPGPLSGPVSRPEAGSMTWAPLARTVSTLA